MIESDDVFDALADVQRRRLLVDLLDSDPQHVPALSGASREMAGAHEELLDRFLSGSRVIPEVDKELLRQYHFTSRSWTVSAS